MLVAGRGDRPLSGFLGRLFGAGRYVPPPRDPSRMQPVELRADAPGVPGTRVAFSCLPDGTLLVADQQGEASLEPLADAVEEQVAAPYRAVATRAGAGAWTVAVTPIELVDVPRLAADRVRITAEGEDLRSDAPIERRLLHRVELLASRYGYDDWTAELVRVDGRLFELTVTDR